jgi:hypothetical protein
MRAVMVSICVVLAGACAPAWAAQSYEGIAYAPGGSRVLYRETHWVAGHRHLVLYRCPDGRAFARKRLDYAAHATAPDYEVLDARDGYRTGVQTTASGREAFLQERSGARMRRASLPARTVVDAGFDGFIRAAWNRLAGKAGLDVPFLVPSRLQAMRFQLQPRPLRDAGVRVFRLSLASWIGGVLPHIDVTYDAATRTLLRFQGMSDVRDGRGRNLVVDIRFAPDRRRAVPEAALDAAAAVPLDGTCRQ